MNNKKAFWVIILAIVLAFAVVFFMSKNSAKVTLPTEVQDEVVVEDVKKDEPVEVEEIEPKIEIQKDIVKPVNTVVPPIVKPIKTEETKVIEEITIKDEPSKSEMVKSDITKEVDTNAIIINREFKSDAPAKYSFKGYGTLDNTSVK